MLDKATIESTLLERLADLPEGHALDIRTYKRNRSVIFVRQDNERFLVVENGFEKQEFVAAATRLKRTLRKLIKREFPRSTKIRVYSLGMYSKESGSLARKIL